jgi:hypothetical protein
MDCDTFALKDPTPLFDDPFYRQHGAYFWPDIEGHFTPDANLFDRANIDQELFPLQPHAWWVMQGECVVGEW